VEQGYGDFELVPDFSTLRRVPWQSGTALVFADLRLTTGEPVRPSPRQVLQRQRDRLAERGWHALSGTELEFIVYRDSYEDAWRSGYRDLTRPTCTTSTTRSWAPPGSSHCCRRSPRA